MKRKQRPLDDTDAIIRDLRDEIRKERERHRRVTAAFLALREVKTQRRDTEPVLLGVLNQIQAAHETIVTAVTELEHAPDAEAKQKAIGALQAYAENMTRIRRYAQKRLDALDLTPVTPALMRYIAADRDLKPGDLELRS
jgi:hypothetical protein